LADHAAAAKVAATTAILENGKANKRASATTTI
jgi:hypothetical protein